MGMYRLMPPLVLLAVFMVLGCTCRVINGRDVSKVGFCAGINQEFSVQSLDCRQTYSLLNVTLQTNLQQTPCSISEFVIDNTPDLHNQECSNAYVNGLLTHIILINNCSEHCDKNLKYGLKASVSDLEHVRAACCSAKPGDCVVDQMWLYYECDSHPIQEADTRPTTPSEISEQITTVAAGTTFSTSESTASLAMTRPGTLDPTTPVARTDDWAIVGYSVLGSVIICLSLVLVIVVAVCHKKLKLSKTSHELPTGGRDIPLSNFVPDLLTSTASPTEPETRQGQDSPQQAQAQYELISDVSLIEPEFPARDKSRTPGRQNNCVVLAPRPPDVKIKASTMRAGRRMRPARNDYCLATKIESVELGAFHVGNVDRHVGDVDSGVEESPLNGHGDDTILVDNETYASPL